MRPSPTLILCAAPREARALEELRLLAGHTIVRTGVGKAAAAAATERALASGAWTRVVQVGCGGAYPGSGLALGDVAIGTEAIFGDEGVETDEGFLGLEALGLSAGQNAGRSVHDRIPVAAPDDAAVRALGAGSGFRVMLGPLLTVSTGAGTDERATEMARRWAPLAESMEGAAAALVCLQRDVPFVEIRGISNFVGRRDRGAWKIDLAVRHAGEVAARLIELDP